LQDDQHAERDRGVTYDCANRLAHADVEAVAREDLIDAPTG
jgi:hypothetical protein